MENDALIQETVRSEFINSTVATVAHRLNTVADSDVVMVLDKGVLTEMDSPAKLVSRERSTFRNLIHATGEASSKHLMNFIMSEKTDKSIGTLLTLDAASQRQADSSKMAKEEARQERRKFREVERLFEESTFSIPSAQGKKNTKK